MTQVKPKPTVPSGTQTSKGKDGKEGGDSRSRRVGRVTTVGNDPIIHKIQ